MHENREIPPLAHPVDRRVGRPGNADGGTPGMNEGGKSDDRVVPVKPLNKGPAAAGTAEMVEGRRSAKGGLSQFADGSGGVGERVQERCGDFVGVLRLG